MKSSIRVWSVVLAAAMIVSVSVAQAAPPNKVFAVKTSLKGRVEDDSGRLASYTVTGNALLNIARGRDQAATVPANEVLAARIYCSPGSMAELVVFDTNGSTNLVVIATSADGEAIAAGTKAEFSALLDVQECGNSANGINSGSLMVSGKATADTNGCPTKVTMTVTGFLDITITDDVGTNNVTALIPKGSLSTGAVLYGP